MSAAIRALGITREVLVDVVEFYCSMLPVTLYAHAHGTGLGIAVIYFEFHAHPEEAREDFHRSLFRHLVLDVQVPSQPLYRPPIGLKIDTPFPVDWREKSSHDRQLADPGKNEGFTNDQKSEPRKA
ncbi:hypothetical protein D3C84_875030 [compost metagenome]